MEATKPLARRMNAQERRTAIVDAAVKLFSERGFRGTTTRELAAAVGVTEPVLYEHFKTKRDLYTAIVDNRSQEGAELLKRIAQMHLDSADDRGFFLTLGRLFLKWYTEHGAFIRLLLFSGLEGHELKDLWYERQSRGLADVIAEYIERRQRDGALAAGDSLIAARAFICMVAHHGLTLLLFRCPSTQFDQEEVIEQMVDIYLNGIVSKGEAR